MAKEPKPADGNGESYKDVVDRLEQVVRGLEGGDLSLEDSLKAFEEGITLVRKGEELLTRAEKRIEQLLSDDGATAPLQGQPGQATPPAPTRAPARSERPEPPPPDDEDVPF